LAGKPEGKTPLGRHIHRKIILKWIFKGWMGEWTGLIWLRIVRDGGGAAVNIAMNLWVP
jgi:hypothetical protein